MRHFKEGCIFDRFCTTSEHPSRCPRIHAHLSAFTPPYIVRHLECPNLPTNTHLIIQVWYSNVPHPGLVTAKKEQNWVRMKGDKLVFPGGGTQFRQGVSRYIDFLGKVRC